MDATLLNTVMFTDRRLYDAKFVDMGCPPELYDANTKVDNTVGTWATNYAILGLGLLFPLLFWRKGREGKSVWLGWYFGLTAMGYGIAGIGHQKYDERDDIPDLLEPITVVIVSMSFLSLQYHQLARTIKWRLLLLGVYLVFLAIAAAIQSSAVLGIYFLIVLVVVGGYELCWERNIWASLGCWVYIAGLLVQILLADKCGDAAYERDCFAECPLSPLSFNHNALFHILVILALILQFVGHYRPEGPLAEEEEIEHQDQKEQDTPV